MSMDDPRVWGQAGYSEKCEILRREIHTIKDAINALTAQLNQTKGAVNANAKMLEEVSKAVAKLESEMPAKSGNK
jgi:hypothetical protein